MPKVDTSVLIADTRKTTTYTYTSPFPDIPYVFNIRPLNAIEELAISGVTRPLIQRFIVGNWVDQDGREMKERDILRDGNGRQISIEDPEPIYEAARIQMMQDPEAGDVYSATEVLRIMFADPDTWHKLQMDILPHLGGKGWAKKDAEDSARNSPNLLMSPSNPGSPIIPNGLSDSNNGSNSSENVSGGYKPTNLDNSNSSENVSGELLNVSV